MVALAPDTSPDGPVLPTGTVTFVFTDIEGSTQLVQRIGDDAFREVIETHDDLLRRSFESNGGVVVRTEGDAFFVAFSDAADAIRGAVDAQRAITGHEWGDAPLRIRIGLHTGTGRLGGDNYVGFDVHRAARISSVAWGGQVVVSSTVVDGAGEVDGVSFRDLGLHRLKDVSAPEHLHQVVAAGLAVDFPEIRSLEVSPHRLPNPVSSFIGRARDLDDVTHLVATGNRMVTLTGPGGTGKTRLAIAVAHRVADEFPDGAYFVPLAPISDPGMVPTTVVESMGAQRPAGGIDPAEHVIGLLTGRRVLLVLDNFEHVLEAGAFVADLLVAVPGLRVLATSRAPLRIDGEVEVSVEPLPVPAASSVDPAAYPSVELFLDRAGLPRVGQSIDDEELTTICRLVRRLDGLPLAIEIAAARARTIPAASILERLDSVLRSDRRDLPERQRTIDATIAWSYDLLDPASRDVFERLGAFSGGAGLSEVETIADDLEGDVWDALGHLVDHSLLIRADVQGVPRFRMLETIHSFAGERLDGRPDAIDLQRRHCRIYLGLVEEAAAHLKSSRRAEWLDRLEVDHGNIRTSLDRAIAMSATEIALRLLAGSWRFWQMRGHLHRAVPYVDAVLALPGGSDRDRAAALRAAGGIAYWRGDLESQARYYRHAVEVARRAGEAQLLADTLYDASYSLASEDGFDTGKAILDEAEAIYRSLGDRTGIAHVDWLWGSLWQMRDDFAAAAEACRRSIEAFDPEEDAFDLGWAEFMYADNLIQLGRSEEAEHHLRHGLESFVVAGDLSALPLFLVLFASLAFDDGDPVRGMRLVAAASRISRESGAGMIEHDPRMSKRYPHQPIASLAPELRAAHEAGLAMSVDEAIAFATDGAPA